MALKFWMQARVRNTMCGGSAWQKTEKRDCHTQFMRLESPVLPGTFETEAAVPQASPRELPPSLNSVSKTLHSCKIIACCVVKCFSMLEVFPPFDVIKALHVLQLALVLSFLMKYNQTLERFCLDDMLETFWAKIWSMHKMSSSGVSRTGSRFPSLLKKLSMVMLHPVFLNEVHNCRIMFSSRSFLNFFPWLPPRVI